VGKLDNLKRIHFVIVVSEEGGIQHTNTSQSLHIGRGRNLAFGPLCQKGFYGGWEGVVDLR